MGDSHHEKVRLPLARNGRGARRAGGVYGGASFPPPTGVRARAARPYDAFPGVADAIQRVVRAAPSPRAAIQTPEVGARCARPDPGGCVVVRVPWVLPRGVRNRAGT